MKRQTYYDYVFSRVEFQLATALFVEYDFEINLRSDFELADDWEDWKTKIVKIKPTAKELTEHDKYDLCFEAMKFAKEFRTSPVNIANKLKPYIEELPFVDRVEIVGGYMNIFFDRANFLLMSL